MARRVWTSFSVATLLFVVFCIAGFFAGYRMGFQALLDDVSLDVRTFSVDDLLTGTDEERRASQVRGIIAEITETINPSNWEEVGGKGFIVAIGGTEKPFGAAEVLKVVALRKDQRQIKNLLTELRRRKAREGAEFRPREIELTPPASRRWAGRERFDNCGW